MQNPGRDAGNAAPQLEKAAALVCLRERLRKRGPGLLPDLVSNHRHRILGSTRHVSGRMLTNSNDGLTIKRQEVILCCQRTRQQGYPVPEVPTLKCCGKFYEKPYPLPRACDYDTVSKGRGEISFDNTYL